MTPRLRKNIRKHLRGLPSVSDIVRDARLGASKKAWYQNANKMINYLYGKDASLFIGLLSATSPRQTVSMNLAMAEKIYETWKQRKRPKDNKSLEEIAKLSDLRARELNVIRAFKGKPLSGNKVESFRQNLLGNLDRVTIDTWMITYSGLHNKNIASSNGGYLAYSARIRRASRILKWKPAEVQASIWSYCYSKTEKIPIDKVPELELENVII